MKQYDPTKLEDVVKFLGIVNKEVYGVNPFAEKKDDRYPRKDGMVQVDENIYLK